MRKIMTMLVAIAMTLLTATSVFAQGGYQVKGVVLDQNGPIIGATIIEKGTLNGTSTDLDGNYILRVSGANATVEISCIGYKTASYAASQVPSTVTLVEDSEFIEDAVVVGYGSLEKKEISSSIVSVSAENFNKAAADPMQLLVGKVAGLNIDVSANGNSSSFQIRGATSINGGNSPLVVIDGVAGASLSSVSNQDIESISILKDGASAAIYGTRGANGVILVTTKKGSGEAGRTRVTYDSYYAIQVLHKMPEVYDLDEWLELNKVRGKADYGNREDKAYWNALRNDKPTYDHNEYISLAGSTAKSNYNLSLNYVDRNELYKNKRSKSYSARFSINQKMLGDFVELSTIANIRASKNQGNNGNLTGTIFMNPTKPVYDESTASGYFWPTDGTGSTNSVENNQLPTNESHSTSTQFQEDVKLNLLRNDNMSLTTNATVALNYSESRSARYTPSIMQVCQMWNDYSGAASLSSSSSLSRSFEWLVNFNYIKGKSSLKTVAGYSYRESGSEGMSLDNKDFEYDNFLWYNIGSGSYLKSGQASMGSSKSYNKIAGVFARATYSWGNLFTATGSLRYEGSSKFGKNKKYGLFPAISGAWTISNMDFMSGSRSWLDELKFRASYGVTGRNAGSDYASLATYSNKGSHYMMDGEWVKGFGITRNANPNLGWETAVVYDYGFDFAMFGNRLTGSIEYFDRRSENLLYTYTAPQPPYVYNSIQLNLGSTVNRGMELALSYSHNFSRDFRMNVSGTYSYGISKLASIGNDVYAASYIDMGSTGGLGSSDAFFRLYEGTRIGTLRGFKYAGYTEDGMLLHETADGGTAIKTGVKDNDKVTIGNTLPKHSFSLNFTFNYKQWDLSINGRGLAGMDIWNSQKQNYGYPGVASDNLLKTAYTKYSYLTADNDYLNSFFLEKGDWFKIEKVSVGRNFKFQKNAAGFESAYAYLAATNLLTLTGFTGVDPSTVSSIGLTPGIAGNSVLYTTKITLGISAKF